MGFYSATLHAALLWFDALEPHTQRRPHHRIVHISQSTGRLKNRVAAPAEPPPFYPPQGALEQVEVHIQRKAQGWAAGGRTRADDDLGHVAVVLGASGEGQHGCGRVAPHQDHIVPRGQSGLLWGGLLSADIGG